MAQSAACIGGRTTQQASQQRLCNRRQRRSCVARASASDPLLLRVARGEDAERTPVWLMRQAGRYMAAFREYSDKYGFRYRSETPEVAIALSLQPWEAFATDGVIMFSDILTPLPAMGIEFDVIKGKGPRIANPIQSAEDVRALKRLDDPDSSLPFIREILSSLRDTLRGSDATLLGFIGTPWTLAAYAIEGKASKNLEKTTEMMCRNPALLHAVLSHLADSLAVYVCHQIDCGAQVVQLFDSWAHELSPADFEEFSLPYANRIVEKVKAQHPHVPLIFHANGGVGKLHCMADCKADVIGLDWSTDMAEARRVFGERRVLQGNVNPRKLLCGNDETIRTEVATCLEQAGRKHHILNVGHGVIQGTPEENVALFCELARQTAAVRA